MKLNEQISINSGYTRSVNVERDSEGLELVSNYIPTSRALRTLARVSDGMHAESAQRAWSLVGPYGSGKSSFALFLSHLFSAPESDSSTAAFKVLRKADRNLARTLKQTKPNFLRVLVSGSPEPLVSKVLNALHQSLVNHYSKRGGRKPKIISEIEDSLERGETTVASFMGHLTSAESALEKTGISGLVFVIDELGKFLEYEARHYGANDIFLLQALAEHSARASKFNVFLFVLLHQSFEQYAKGLGESLKNEWGKIQGRFEEVPFLESDEQVLRVVSAAFKRKGKGQPFLDVVRKPASKLAKLKALPGLLNGDEALSLFEGCYPLHPVTALILPSLCQKIAQNERTLFSYLGSHEEHGFTRELEILDLGEFVTPDMVFDYFVSSQSSVMADYAVHRRWVEVQTALDRLGDASPDAIRLLKAIGLFNIMGSKGELKASKEILLTISKTPKELDENLDFLLEKSVINYRKFSHEYRVWQGSDFDLESEVELELNNIGEFSLSEELNKSEEVVPVVARKYSIERGTLRHFDPVFVDWRSYMKTGQDSDTPRIIYYLSYDEGDKLKFESLYEFYKGTDVLVRCSTSEKVKEAVSEVLALRRIQANSSALNDDPIAKREFEDRLFSAAGLERTLINSFVEKPEEHEWYFRGERLPLASKRELQSRLSEVLETVYSKAPVIHNELINRDRPSTQANAARNKLLLAMSEREPLHDLGIDKFPAEKSIYRALLYKTGIHESENDLADSCRFCVPNENETNIHHVWERIEKFLESTEKSPRSFIELNQELMSPPYGVKAGLLPILYFAVYLTHRAELAIYENRRYRPNFSEEMIERFTKKPADFTVQRFRIDGLRSSIFQQYSKVIQSKKEAPTLLELATPLARFMGELPEYTQKTRKGLSPRAQDVRGAFNLAKSPQALLFEELPKALGFSCLEDSTEDDLAEFAEELRRVLVELRECHQTLLNKQKSALANLLGCSPEMEIRELRQISTQLFALNEYAYDEKGLNMFISRLTKMPAELADEDWLENVVSFLGRKPTKKWLDSDRDIAESRLKEYTNGILELERLRLLVKETQKEGKSEGVEFYLLRSLKAGSAPKNKEIVVTDAVAKGVETISEKIVGDLHAIENDNLRFAVLAKLMDRFLPEEETVGFKPKVISGGKDRE